MSGAVSVKHCSLVIISDNDCEEKSLIGKQWKKEQGSRCCTADVCLRQSVNQLYNNQRMTKVVLFSTACLLACHQRNTVIRISPLTNLIFVSSLKAGSASKSSMGQSGRKPPTAPRRTNRGCDWAGS